MSLPQVTSRQGLPYEGFDANVEGISDEVLAITTRSRRKQWKMQVLLPRLKTCHLHH